MFIVALPFGVLHGGYWAILAMVGISHICCHTGKILVECLYEVDETGGHVEPVKIRFSYKEIGESYEKFVCKKTLEKYQSQSEVIKVIL